MPPKQQPQQSEEAREERVVLPPGLRPYLDWLTLGFPTASDNGALKLASGGENWRDKFPHGPVHLIRDPATFVEQRYPTKEWDDEKRALVRDLHALACDVIVCDPLVFGYDALICHEKWQVKEATGKVTGVRAQCIQCGSNKHTTATAVGWSHAKGNGATVHGKYTWCMLVGKPIRCKACKNEKNNELVYPCMHAHMHLCVLHATCYMSISYLISHVHVSFMCM